MSYTRPYSAPPVPPTPPMPPVPPTPSGPGSIAKPTIAWQGVNPSCIPPGGQYTGGCVDSHNNYDFYCCGSVFGIAPAAAGTTSRSITQYCSQLGAPCLPCQSNAQPIVVSTQVASLQTGGSPVYTTVYGCAPLNNSSSTVPGFGSSAVQPPYM